MKANKILLLGAGFSNNFGLPLAQDMWIMIFEHIDKRNRYLVSAFREEPNYELMYQKIINQNNESLKGDVNKAIQKTFMDIDNAAIQSLSNNESKNKF